MKIYEKYRPNMGKMNVFEGERLLFPFRTLSHEISKIIGEVVAFGKTNDGFEYVEVKVGAIRL
ncbi:hypothetical protein [Bacillus toyonensis]|uniref:hypothetical protein n=1 Tax=Bacillus toyonensis TaxID=155322 RepID=UPI000BFBF57D|nr:hypothetical protein [Bacillus toyonensis]PHG61807.1 hypothetical protein COI59_21670 [Bacillus toyonensis]